MINRLAQDRDAVLQAVLQSVDELEGHARTHLLYYLLASDDLGVKRVVLQYHPRDAPAEPANTLGGGIWAGFFPWLKAHAFDRCLAASNLNGATHALALLELQSDHVLPAFDSLIETPVGAHRPFRHLLEAIWILSHAGPAPVRRNLPRIEPDLWIERYQAHLLAGRHRLPGWPCPPCELSPVRPDWVPRCPPALVRDGLTGALRRAALARTERDMFRQPPPVDLPGRWLLLGDLDGLLRLNDHHGFVVGDMTLRAVVDTLQSVVGDRVIRWGGDVFLIPLESDGPAEARKLVAALDGTTFGPFGDLARTIRITISMGATRNRDPEDSLQTVEQAMYEAKVQGGNRVVVR